MKCANCGQEAQEGAKFCSSCGTALSQNEYAAQDNITKTTLGTKIKTKIQMVWNQLAVFYKVSLVAIFGIIILFLVAYFTSKTFAIVCTVLQFVGVNTPILKLIAKKILLLKIRLG